jgi:hypothetical protein
LFVFLFSFMRDTFPALHVLLELSILIGFREE